MIGKPTTEEQIDKALAKVYTFLLELAHKKCSTASVVDSDELSELYQLNSHPKYNNHRENDLVNSARSSTD